MPGPAETLDDASAPAWGLSLFQHAVQSLARGEKPGKLESLLYEIGILLIFFTDLSLHGSDSTTASDQILGGTFDAIGSLLETVGQAKKAGEIRNLKRRFSSPDPA